MSDIVTLENGSHDYWAPVKMEQEYHTGVFVINKPDDLVGDV